MISTLSNLKKYLILVSSLSILLTAIVLITQTHAAPVVGFNAGKIIDDAVFTNKYSMSAGDIQTFLNAKGASCINGEAPCLKNFNEGGRSAAQIIYDTAHQYNINPQVLIVVLQKEVGLVTMSQPGAWRYRTAMGYGCPDSTPGVCDTRYYGFTNQMRWAATMYNAIMTDSPNWYTPYNLGNNNIKWNPESSCGSSVVNIENRATKALYNYTPYRPNQAALDAGYGLGNSCSSYGNRNFFLYFRDWFGATTDNRLFFRVIQGSDRPEVYLQTSVGKYYVPSYALLEEWGLFPRDVVGVPQSYSDSLPSKGTLSNSLTDGSGNLFVVEGTNTHQVTSSIITSVWNVDTSNMVESLGLTYTLNRKEPLGRFISEKNGDGSIWLVDGAKRHKVDTSLLYTWGYYPGITNTVSSNLFSRYTIADPVTQFASFDNGATTWGIEASTKRPFKDVPTKNAYIGSSTIANVGLPALTLMNNGELLTRFAYDRTYGHWYMIDGGKKYYISKAEMAGIWGKSPSDSPSGIGTDFLSKIPSNGNLTHTARSASSSAYWLIAKKKYYISNSDLNIGLTGSSSAPPVYSDELINSFQQGGNITSSLRGSSSPYNYSYILDKGFRRYPASSTAQSAWLSDVTVVPNELMTIIPEGSFLGNIVKTNDGSAYYVDNGVKYPIAQSNHSEWNISQHTPVVDISSLNRMQSGTTLSNIFNVNGTTYIMNGGARIKVNKHRDAYPSLSSPSLSTPGDMKDGGEASYLIKSSAGNDERVWLVNGGSKIPVSSFEQQVALGYISNSIPITTLAPDLVNSIPNSQSTYSNLIQTGTSGIKFVNFGYALGFPDGPTLTAHIDSSGILNVSKSIYDTFTVRSNISRLVYDDLGRHYWIENGKKRYINTWTAYNRDGYPNINAVYLQGITMNLIPNGTTIQ